VEVLLTDDQKVLVRRAIEAGRYTREEDALREALLLWEERERRREEILHSVDQAEASLARGEGRTIASREEASALAREISDRAAARPAANATER